MEELTDEAEFFSIVTKKSYNENRKLKGEDEK
jgi:hypothetical protein